MMVPPEGSIRWANHCGAAGALRRLPYAAFYDMEARRRRQTGWRSIRRSCRGGVEMKDSGRMRWVGVLLIGWVSVLVGEAKGFDAQEFSPAVDPEGYFSVYSSRTAPRGRFHLGIWYNFADDPISASEFNEAFPNQLPAGKSLVEHIHTIDLVASYSLLDW